MAGDLDAKRPFPGPLAAILLTLVAVGLLIVPRALSYVASLGSRETTLVASIGVCFAFALVAEAFDRHIPKGYIYFAMGFSVFVEMLNLHVRPLDRVPVKLHQTYGHLPAEE